MAIDAKIRLSATIKKDSENKIVTDLQKKIDKKPVELKVDVKKFEKELDNIGKKYQEKLSKIEKMDLSKSFGDFSKQLKEMSVKEETTKKQEMKDLLKSFGDFSKELKEVSKQEELAKKQEAEMLKNREYLIEAQKRLNNEIKKSQAWGLGTGEEDVKSDAFTNALNLSGSLNVKDTQKIREATNALYQQRTEYIELKNASDAFSTTQERANIKLQNSKEIIKDSAWFDFKDKLQNIDNKFEEISNSSEDFYAKSVKIKELRKELLSFNRQLDQANTTQRDFGKTIADNVKKFSMWFTASNIVMKTIQVLKQMVNTVVELDKAFTNIQMVTGYTNEQMEKLEQNCSKLASALKTTTSEVADAYNEWLRTGLAINEVNEAVEATIKLSKIAGVTSSQATEMLISVMKGYKQEASDLVSIIDKLSAVDMASASSSEELATAMGKVASTAYNAGVEMDTLLGYIGKIIDVTQQSAETVGTAKYFGLLYRNI